MPSMLSSTRPEDLPDHVDKAIGGCAAAIHVLTEEMRGRPQFAEHGFGRTRIRHRNRAGGTGRGGRRREARLHRPWRCGEPRRSPSGGEQVSRHRHLHRPGGGCAVECGAQIPWTATISEGFGSMELFTVASDGLNSTFERNEDRHRSADCRPSPLPQPDARIGLTNRHLSPARRFAGERARAADIDALAGRNCPW